MELLTEQIGVLAALVIKENAIRKSNELPHGFSLWQEMDDGFEGL
jgi:hypothetical protein